jgi:hypothetical protein
VSLSADQVEVISNDDAHGLAAKIPADIKRIPLTAQGKFHILQRQLSRQPQKVIAAAVDGSRPAYMG